MMKNRIVAFCMCVMLIFVMSAGAVHAIDLIDVSQKAELTVVFAPDGTPVENIKFSLYRLADVNAKGEYMPVSRFSGYNLQLKDHTVESWRLLATSLTGIISADKQEPDFSANTNSEGKAVFEGLTLGLYYVAGEIYHGDRVFVTPTPFLISLPDRAPTADKWEYDVELYSKYSTASDSKPVNIELLKIWNDNDNAERPSRISVELYDGDKLYDTVVLDKSNNWRYKWKDLYGGTVWSIKESDVPEGYTVSVERQNDCFVITNTKSSDPSQPSLPQTGVNWLPVPFLAIAGLAMVFAGVVRRRG